MKGKFHLEMKKKKLTLRDYNQLFNLCIASRKVKDRDSNLKKSIKTKVN